MRAAILILLLGAVFSEPLAAGTGDPVRYTRGMAWRGRVLSMGDGSGEYLVVTPRPAWSSAIAALTVVSADERRRTDGLLGDDVRDALPWSGGILVARVEERGVRISHVGRDLSTVLTPEIDLPVDIEADPSTHVRIIGTARSPFVIIRVGDAVVAVRRNNGSLLPTLLERNVFSVGWLNDGGRGRVALAYAIGAQAFMTVLDSTLKAIATVPVPASDAARIESVGRYVVMLSTLEGATGSVLSLVEPETFTVGTRPVPVDESLVRPIRRPSGVILAMLTTRNGRPEVVITPANDVPDVLPSGTMIPGDYGSPRALLAMGDTLVVVFAGGVVTLGLDGSIISADAVSIGVGSDCELVAHRSGLVLSTPSSSVVLVREDQPLWWIIRAWDTILTFVVPLALLSGLAVVWLLYRRQRRFFDAMIDVPGAGLVFVLDGNGRLVRTNERAAALLRITKNVPMRRLFRAYTQRTGLDALTRFLSSVQTSRAPLSERVVVTEFDEQREYMFTSIPLVGLLGRNVGSIVTGVDITEALERRRLVNWAQLAHDMQTNLSTIRLNAEQLTDESDTRNVERRRRILFQVGVLIQRVRDLVSVGRSEDLTRVPVHSAELCTEIRHEFDPAMFPHVTFQMKLKGTMMHVDRLKVSRAVRNAVENAIKSLRGHPGTVEIATWFDRANVFIRVSDTGVGMDAETLANMMKPYFTTAKDGTGTGIGTMIMQHVMNLHGGSLRVTSEPGVGTQVIFRIPHDQGARG